MKNLFFYQTAIGKIGICETHNAITNLYFPAENIPGDVKLQETAILKDAAEQLKNYLAGKQNNFNLPLSPAGSNFFLRVWQQLEAIPYGQTRSYQSIAQSVGNPKASRAVGLANNRNPVPIFIPCHRVIGTKGHLTGYRGGLELKAYLLELEQTHGNF